jgi:hypothetical protein
MLILNKDAEIMIKMLVSEIAVEEAKAQKPVKNSNDFPEISNLVENLLVTVENFGVGV